MMEGNAIEKNKGKAETTMEDRLSALPDEILQHILSCLETKQAVQTSILSRRWRYLWTTLTIININSESFRYYYSFANFVVDVLSRREDSSVNFCKFWFDISNPIYSSIQMCIDSHDLFEPLVKRVIDHVVIHGIKILNLHFPRIVDDLYLLFNCQSLITLELHELVFLPISLDFATLTTLNLSKCSFILSDEDSFDPFKGCLNLKNLVISDCRIPSRVKTFQISAPELTNLTISTMDHVRNLNSNCKIVLSSANMKTFTFVYSHALEFSVADLPYLERVHVDANIPDYLYGNNLVAKRKLLSHMIDMFRAMGNAEIVSLSIDTVNVLSKFPDELCDPSPFPQMKTLKIKKVPHQPNSNTVPDQVMNFFRNGSRAKDFKLECLSFAGEAFQELDEETVFDHAE